MQRRIFTKRLVLPAALAIAGLTAMFPALAADTIQANGQFDVV